MRKISVGFLCSILVLVTVTPYFARAEGGSSVSPAPQVSVKKYPSIKVYGTSWCPHCQATKEYLTERGIPFEFLDVEEDEEAMERLTVTYAAQSVPLVVIGDDAKILRGFSPEKFEKALQELSQSEN